MTPQDPNNPNGLDLAPTSAADTKKPATRSPRGRKPAKAKADTKADAATTTPAAAKPITKPTTKPAAKPRTRSGKTRRNVELVREEPMAEATAHSSTEAAVADLLASLTPTHASPLEDLFGAPPAEEPTGPAPAVIVTEVTPDEPAPAPVRRYRFDRRSPGVPEAPHEQPPVIDSVPVARPEAPVEADAPQPAPTSEAEAPVVMNGTHAKPANEAAAPEAAAPDEHTETEVAAAESTEATTDGAGATRRRRRRRRTTGHSGTEEAEVIAAEPVEAAEAPAAPAEPEHFLPSAPYKPGGRGRRTPPRAAAETPATLAPAETEPEWGYSDARSWSPEAAPSPYDSPEPSVARGFGPQPRAVAQPAREPLTRGTRNTLDAPPISSNSLASTITGSIQTMTDRLLVEMRRQPPTPQMTVMMSNSTERVGVFVDVANVVYSARALRNQVDFGQLLAFLRGNRRLIRAHAYAPTEPDPRGEQMFLSVVKGHGYRITTKNYKTFASGAKKADLDLDLCMDIVRLVDSGAIDTLVLVSGDSDFLPLLEYCSDKGVRVEVAAFDDAAAAILRQSCDLFINLSRVPDILS